MPWLNIGRAGASACRRLLLSMRCLGVGEVRQVAARRLPSHKVRVAAARVRVDSDRQVHRRTPQWIKELAGSGNENRRSEFARHTRVSMNWLRALLRR